jgi:hypothetical protein
MTQEDKDELHDYVLAHGFGPPSKDGYKLGEILIGENGDSYADAAFEIVFRGYTEELEEQPGY